MVECAALLMRCTHYYGYRGFESLSLRSGGEPQGSPPAVFLSGREPRSPSPDQPTMRPTFALGVALAVLSALLGGCASRTVTITSEPSGAEVIFDRRPVGMTPVTVPIRYGGVHEVILLKSDRSTGLSYRPVVALHDSENFWLDNFPFDAVAELAGAEDARTLHVELQASRVTELYDQDPTALLQALQERAMTLRARAQASALEASPRAPAQ